MTSLQFSDAPTGNPFTHPTWVKDTVITVYEDAAASVLADVSLTDGGAAVSGSTLTVTGTRGEVPVFYSRDSFKDTLYLKVGTNVVPIKSTTAPVDLAARYDTSELGYAERTTASTTTNTDFAASISNKISGLSVTVVGEGLPVVVEFYCASSYHSVAGTGRAATLLINGALAGGQFGFTDAVASIGFKRRLVLTAGVSYTFEVGKFVGAAGTGTFDAAVDYPMHLSVNR